MNTLHAIHKRNHGFSLVELMVTLVILGILTTLASPTMREIFVKSKLTSISNEFSSHILRARNEAVSRNTCTVMCISTTTSAAIATDSNGNLTAGPKCANAGTDWQVGWILFIKEDCVNGTQTANSRPARPEDYVVMRSSAGDNYFLNSQSGAGTNRLFFTATGRPGLNGAEEFDLVYEASNNPLTLAYSVNICVDALGRTRNIASTASCN
jgi:type IV fimbrial biogenesis protein FimT